MMMRFYNSRVEHIVTKNNEFFEQCDGTTLFYCYGKPMFVIQN